MGDTNDKKSQDVHVGYKFYLSVLFGLCHGPIDGIKAMWVADETLSDAPKGPSRHYVSKPELFDEKQGGVQGWYEIRQGNTTDPKPTVMNRFVGAVNTAYRGIAAIVLDNMYLGNNPYLKPWQVRVQRVFKRISGGSVVDQWYSDKAGIGTPYDFEGTSVTPQLPESDPRVYVARNSNKDKVIIPSTAAEGNENVAHDKNRGMRWVKEGNTIYAIRIWDQEVLEEIDVTALAATYATLRLAHVWPDDTYMLYTNNFTSSPSHIIACKVEGGALVEKTSNTNYAAAIVGHHNLTPNVTLSQPFLNESHTFTYIDDGGNITREIGGTHLNPYVPEGPWGWFPSLKCVVGIAYQDAPNTDIWLARQDYDNDFIPSTATYYGAINEDSGYTWAKMDFTLTDRKNNLFYVFWTGFEISPVEYTPYYTVYRISNMEKLYEGQVSWSNLTSVDDYPFVNSGGHQGVVLATDVSNRDSIQVIGESTTGHVIGNLYLTSPEAVSFTPVHYIPTPSARSGVLGDGWVSYRQSDGSSITVHIASRAITTLDDEVVDMNPAHIIRECLTDAEWGLGFGDADIDDTSFTAAADTLYNEGFGLSLVWADQKPVEDFIGLVLKHIDAVVYVDRATGLFTLKLIRDDYGTPTTFDDTDIIEVSDYDRRPSSELVNSVTVLYNDRAKKTSTSITVHDIAAIRESGGANPTTISYPGIYSDALASKVATRDLRALGTPIISGQIIFNRKSTWNLNVGDVFDINSSIYTEISNRTFRVMEVDFGDSNSAEVVVSFAEDIFDLGEGFSDGEKYYYDPANLDLPDAATEDAKFVELDYRMYVRSMGEQQASENLTYEPLRSAGLYMVGSSSSNYPYDVYTLVEGQYSRVGTMNPLAILELTSDLPGISDKMTYKFNSGLAQLKSSIDPSKPYLGYCNGELFHFGSGPALTRDGFTFEEGDEYSLTIDRGAHDTIPIYHKKGAKVFVLDPIVLDLGDYIRGDEQTVSFSQRSASGVSNPYVGKSSTASFDARLGKPWRAGYNQGYKLFWGAQRTDLTALNWDANDRTLLTDSSTNVPHFQYGSTGAETNTVFDVTVDTYDISDTLLTAEVNSTGVSAETLAVTPSSWNAAAVYAKANISTRRTTDSEGSHVDQQVWIRNVDNFEDITDLQGVIDGEVYDSSYYSTHMYSDASKTTLIPVDTANSNVRAWNPVVTGTSYTGALSVSADNRVIFYNTGAAPYPSEPQYVNVEYPNYHLADSTGELQYTPNWTGILYYYSFTPVDENTWSCYSDSFSCSTGVAVDLTTGILEKTQTTTAPFTDWKGLGPIQIFTGAPLPDHLYRLLNDTYIPYMRHYMGSNAVSEAYQYGEGSWCDFRNWNDT